MLETAAQPIWVVDPDGMIRFANPAAIAALGYDSAEELFGRHSHETIHYKHPDGTPYPAAECPMLLPRATGETVESDLDWFFRRDGSMFPVSYVSAPIEMPEGRGAVVAFTDIEDRLRAERVLREHDAVLAAREASLRRIATLVAGGAASAEVFAAIAREVAQVLGVSLVVIWRYEADRPATVVGAWGDRPHPFQAGTTWPVEEHTVAVMLPEMGRPTWIEDFGEIGGMIPDAIAGTGIRSGSGAAIIVDGELWGVMGAGVAESEPLVDHIEDRLVEFTELVATAISNSASGESLPGWPTSRPRCGAWRRWSRAKSPPARSSRRSRKSWDGCSTSTPRGWSATRTTSTATVVSTLGRLSEVVPVGTRLPLGGVNVISKVSQTGRPARIDDYGIATGVISGWGRRAGRPVRRSADRSWSRGGCGAR